MEQAEKLCDELLMIDHGQTVLHGSPAEIKRVHGRNALHVEFSGDGAFLRDLPDVRVTDLSQNYAELELSDQAKTNDIIAAMLPEVDIQRVARIEPSLHAIFLDVAGKDNTASNSPRQASEPPPPKLTSKDPRVRRQFFNMLIFLTVAIVISLNFRAGFDMTKGVFVLIAMAAAAYSFFRFQRFRKEAAEAPERIIPTDNGEEAK
jgi:hypothetical protein